MLVQMAINIIFDSSVVLANKLIFPAVNIILQVIFLLTLLKGIFNIYYIIIVPLQKHNLLFNNN